jgi:transposase, IS30 family
MTSHYEHLSLEKHRKIAKWREGKMPVPEIADRLSRPPAKVVESNLIAIINRLE